MAGSEKPVFFDSTVLINFGETKSFHLLLELYSKRMTIVEEVKQEIINESYETKRVLKTHLARGSIDLMALREPEELKLYDNYCKKIDSGEAATIAAAVSKGGIIVTDDRDARKIAKKREGLKTTGSIGILLRSISENLQSVQEADNLHGKMIEEANYFSPINSIQNYVEEQDLELD